ncbi:hypothetical protein HDU79_009553 [Rhizoclosmatium sp. JEL0117]|nr:hypothetical protein HDU79_009553 [Rhizoclosmatium sp. JEL0117]
MLEGLLHSVSSQSQYFLQPSANSYIHWDWTRELETFWSSAMGPNVPGVTPLYALALNHSFPEETIPPPLPIPALSLNSNNTVGLLDAMAAHQFRDGVRNVVDRSGVKLMPPPSKETETADFALSTTCGPVLGHIRTLDIQPTMTPSNQIIIATAGGEDRHDRKISLWDMKSGTLVSQLDNGTHKPVVSVVFHPTNPDLLLTADMEFCVKLWDWKQSVLVRSWKKHHSRVIWKVAFVPGRETFAASCSGDQSLKIWDTSDPKPTISSVHANEPFTSFVFCGDPSEQTLIASLSYTLRIYKMRTMSLVHTIQLKDLKVNKTPVYSVSSHPLYDNYILIACDNQIRLFDLSSETMLRVFSAREIGAGTRIEGMFSPCGTFVYSGSCDVRSLASNTSVRRASGIQSVVDDGKSVGEEGVNSRGTSPDAKGIFIWRVATGKLERSEMRAMESGEKRIPVTVCKWIQVDGNSKSNRKREEKARKVLVAATVAGTVKLYL